MIVTQYQSEERLVEAVEAYKVKPGMMRALWVQLSLLSDFSHTQLQSAINDVYRMYQEHQYSLFIIEGYGFVILGDKIPAEQVEALRAMLEDVLDTDIPENLVTAFDFKAEWSKVAAKAEALLQEKRDRIHQHKKTEAEAQRQKILNMTFDKEMLRLMQSKRAGRPQIEVMVVEDDPFSRRMVRGALAKHYSTTVAENGYEALTSYVSTAPDVIFLDIELPDINGHEICAKLMEVDSKAYIVMLSGNGDRENIIRAIDQGAQGFVGKPFSKEKLIQYIQKCPTYKQPA